MQEPRALYVLIKILRDDAGDCRVSARRAVAYASRNCGHPPFLSHPLHPVHRDASLCENTLTVYIEVPSFLHLRVRDIWHAGATVEDLSGVFDSRHEREDAGCCVAIGAHLPAVFHEFKTVYRTI